MQQEDAALVEKRSFLLMRQQRIKAALSKIEEFAPDVLAVSKSVDCSPIFLFGVHVRFSFYSTVRLSYPVD